MITMEMTNQITAITLTTTLLSGEVLSSVIKQFISQTASVNLFWILPES